MKKLFLVFVLLLATIGVFAQSPNIQVQNNDQKKDSITNKTYKTDNGWGYDIYIKDKKYIQQQNIPAINGNKPFKTKEDAEKTAELVITKIKKNIMPPSITPTELDSLGVLY